MNKCLVTKLNGVVNNNTILKLGEFRIKVIDAPSSKRSIWLKAKKELNLSIIGDGYFLDNTDTNNIGKTLTLGPENMDEVHFSNGTYEISVTSKYDITEIETKGSNCIIDMSCFNYSKSIKRLIDRYFCLIGKVDLSNLTLLEDLNLEKTNTSNDLSNVGSLNRAKVIMLNNVTGNVKYLYGLNSLNVISLKNANINGDIAKLPSSTYVLSAVGTADLTWSNRDTNGYILAIEGNPKINNIDQMLINQTQCVKHPFPEDEEWYKVISATGNRTSASDAAVETLQQKGYTVSVIPA